MAAAFVASSSAAPANRLGQRRSVFVCDQRAVLGAWRHQPLVENRARSSPPRWTMAKMSKFGPFSPIVILARLVIGEKRFNKIRGKAIALHSQTITNFCTYVGADPKMRTSLIGKAKSNGNTLGFLS